MNLKEAYKTLGLSEGTSPEEAKKQYRKLTKEFHPDVNKDPQAEEKFKGINEAYECVKNGKGNDHPKVVGRANSHGWPFQQQSQTLHVEHIELHLTIDFKESVLGCKKEIKYSRQTKCPNCKGAGEVQLHNGCAKCGGRGRITFSQRGMIIMSTCPECSGRNSTEECHICKGDGGTQADVSIHVSVPAGVIDGNTLRLQGMGNYVGALMGIMDQYSDAFCHITVTSEPELTIEGRSVVSNLTLSLLDAIRGCKCTVKTIYGNKEIQIPALSKNSDEVIIPHCGVAGSGDHKVLLDVQYPKNIDKLVSVLTDEVI